MDVCAYIPQVGLCLSVNCVGISIIWSSVFAFHMTIYHDFISTTTSVTLIRVATFLSTIATVVTWLYYAVTEEMISTVAHLCAAVLGFVLAHIFKWVVFDRWHGGLRGGGGRLKGRNEGQSLVGAEGNVAAAYTSRARSRSQGGGGRE